MNTYTEKKNFTLLPTKRSLKTAERSKTHLRTVKKLALWSAVLLTVYYILTHGTVSAAATENALTLSIKILFPALFPMMIAGEILVASGFPSAVQVRVGNLFERLFGISGRGAGAFIIGAFCGFPVGAKTAVSLYASGEIGKDDAERLSGICNNAGLGFLVSGVGATLWKSTAFGVTVYLSQLISAVACGILLSAPRKERPASAVSPKEKAPDKDFSLSEAITDAIFSALNSMLKVTALTVFFSLMLSAVTDLLVRVGAGALTLSVIRAFTEISTGTVSLRSLCDAFPSFTATAKILTFTFSSFGGISVYMQYCAFAVPLRLRTDVYLKTKLLQSLFCTAIGASLVYLGAV